MTISLFGVASQPADNGSYATDPAVITPPGSMAANDLVVMIADRRASSGTLTISEAGGQTWTSLTQSSNNTQRLRTFWCIFNGTWSANPSVSCGASVCNSVVMLVFRSSAGVQFAADVAITNAAFSAPGSPYTVAITGITIDANGVAIAEWAVAAANTWGSLSGAGWSQTSLSAQYRNTAGSDQSIALAYYIGSGATGNVSLNESAGTAGTSSILSFKELVTRSVNVSDTVGAITDTATCAVTAGDPQVTASDTVGAITDTATASPIPAPSVSDSIAVADNPRRYDDLIGVADIATVSVAAEAPQQVSTSDTVGAITENVTARPQVSVAPSDSVGAITESVTARLPETEVEIFSEPVGAITENVTARPQVSVAPSDSVGAITENIVAAVGSPQVNVSDSVGAITDTATAAVGAAGELNINKSESVGVADTPAAQVSAPAVVASESVGAITDTATAAVGSPQVNVSDSVGAITDTATAAVGAAGELNINKSESVGVADTPAAQVSAPAVNAAETIGAGENVSLALSALQISASDSVTVSESWNTTGVSLVAVSDTIGAISESVSIQVSSVVALAVTSSEAISISDTSGLAVFTTVWTYLQIYSVADDDRALEVSEEYRGLEVEQESREVSIYD